MSPSPTSEASCAARYEAGDDHWKSVARSSYVAHHAARTESLSPARREAERVKEHAKSGPKFAAMSNYDLSFQGASGRASPMCQRDVRASPNLPFVETSTSRASYKGHGDVASFPPRVHGHRQEVKKSLPTRATSNSRVSYVKHQTKVPVRRHEEHRTMPATKFEAMSTAAATYGTTNKAAC